MPLRSPMVLSSVIEYSPCGGHATEYSTLRPFFARRASTASLDACHSFFESA